MGIFGRSFARRESEARKMATSYAEAGVKAPWRQRRLFETLKDSRRLFDCWPESEIVSP